MPAPRIGLSLAFVGMLCAAGAASAVNLLPDRCLPKLEKDTRAWSECVHHFSKSDDRCKLAKNAMAKRVKECERKGHTKTEIDATMTRGYKTAGKPAAK